MSSETGPMPSTLATVTERMHAACATYDVALKQIKDDQLRVQLQNFADENHQHLSLLQQHVEARDVSTALTKAATNATVAAAAWLQAKQVQLGQLLGTEDLFAALSQREQALVEAYGQLCQQNVSDAQLTRLAEDQLSCARERQRWLADPGNVAKQRRPVQDDGVTAEGRRGVYVNTPKKASAENSDC